MYVGMDGATDADVSFSVVSFSDAHPRAPDAEEFGIEAVARLESLVHRRAGDVRVAHDGVEVVFCREGGESFRLGDCVAKRGGVAAVGKPERASPERGARRRRGRISGSPPRGGERVGLAARGDLVVVARDHDRGDGPRANGVEGVDERFDRDGAARVPEIAKEDNAGVAREGGVVDATENLHGDGAVGG